MAEDTLSDENERTVVYGEGEFDGMTFVPKCQQCGRYVTRDPVITVDHNGQPSGSNATCSRHGRTQMIFIGYY